MDCVFGFIVGALATRHGDLTAQKLTQVDAREIWEIVDRRTERDPRQNQLDIEQIEAA